MVILIDFSPKSERWLLATAATSTSRNLKFKRKKRCSFNDIMSIKNVKSFRLELELFAKFTI